MMILKSRWMCMSLVASLLTCACAEGTMPSSEPPPDDIPYEVGGKGDIYGDDDRMETDDSFDPLLRAVADSTAVLVDSSKVESAHGGQMRLVDETFGEEKNLCSGEPFRDQPAPGFCTGFLVAEDTLVTAGHCVENLGDCRDTRVVFDFRYESSDDDPTFVDGGDVFSCDDLLARHYDSSGADWAVLRLDRGVGDRRSVKLRTVDRLEKDSMVALVGHPSGLPQKISGDGRVIDSSADTHFKSDLDTYGGNSGSPVVNFVTGVVEGVHVRGTTDFVETDAGCSVSRVCDEVGDSGCGGNSATRSTQFVPYIPPPASDAGWGRWTSSARPVAYQTVDGLTEAVSEIAVESDGVVNYAQVAFRIDGALDGAEIYLERNYSHTVNLTQYVQARGGTGGTMAVPDFNGTVASASWRLRVVNTSESLPDIDGWTLDLHTRD